MVDKWDVRCKHCCLLLAPSNSVQMSHSKTTSCLWLRHIATISTLFLYSIWSWKILNKLASLAELHSYADKEQCIAFRKHEASDLFMVAASNMLTLAYW